MRKFCFQAFVHSWIANGDFFVMMDIHITGSAICAPGPNYDQTISPHIRELFISVFPAALPMQEIPVFSIECRLAVTFFCTVESALMRIGSLTAAELPHKAIRIPATATRPPCRLPLLQKARRTEMRPHVRYQKFNL